MTTAELKCPVLHCTHAKEQWHLVCIHHWKRVNRFTQACLYRLYREAPGSEAHRKLCFEILGSLNRLAAQQMAQLEAFRS